jgi:hypothetical protein
VACDSAESIWRRLGSRCGLWHEAASHHEQFINGIKGSKTEGLWKMEIFFTAFFSG